MKLPVDDDTLASWAALLGLTPEQTDATLADIETTLRVGYDHRPDELLDMSFDQALADMDIDEAALLFLISGLRRAGHHEAAHSVEVRGLLATLGHLQQTG